MEALPWTPECLRSFDHCDAKVEPVELANTNSAAQNRRAVVRLPDPSRGLGRIMQQRALRACALTCGEPQQVCPKPFQIHGFLQAIERP